MGRMTDSDCVVIRSPFSHIIESFDSKDEESFSDMRIIIQGHEPLDLHRMILARTSEMFASLLQRMTQKKE